MIKALVWQHCLIHMCATLQNTDTTLGGYNRRLAQREPVISKSHKLPICTYLYRRICLLTHTTTLLFLSHTRSELVAPVFCGRGSYIVSRLTHSRRVAGTTPRLYVRDVCVLYVCINQRWFEVVLCICFCGTHAYNMRLARWFHRFSCVKIAMIVWSHDVAVKIVAVK